MAATQKALYQAALKEATPDDALNESADVGIDELAADLVDASSRGSVKKNGKPIKVFDYFQAAITEEFAKLTDDQRKEYELRASKWRTEGPPPEQKRRLLAPFLG